MAPRSSIYEFFNVALLDRFPVHNYSRETMFLSSLAHLQSANLLNAVSVALYPKCKAVNFDVTFV